MIKKIINELPKTNKDIVVILSGGLDSTILTYLLKKHYTKNQLFALSFNYNQKHVIELDKAKITTKKLNIPHKIIDMKFLGDITASVSALSNLSKINMPTIREVLGHPQPNSYSPYRNMIFTSLVFSFAESNNCEYVFSGLQANDLYMYWDTTPEFIERINSVSELNRQHCIKLVAPFVNLTKKDEILIGSQLNVPFQDTHTCYNGNNCGICPSCSERIKNFIDANMIDPIEYKSN